jgi:hypothetical protein
MRISAFEEEDYIAIGSASGIYVSKHAVDHCESSKLSFVLVADQLLIAFRKVLEFNEPTSIVAFTRFNKFIVHCKSALSSYPLELVVRISRRCCISTNP